MKNVLVLLAVLTVLAGCDQKVSKQDLMAANEQLTSKIDSLQSALSTNAYTVNLIDQIGQYMDSIDANRNWIKLNLEEGLAEEDYIGRMKQLNQYVQKAEWTIAELEKSKSAYGAQLSRLKAQLGLKDQEIVSLQESIAQYQIQNSKLQDMLVMTETDLLAANLDLEDARKDLKYSEVRISELTAKVQLTEAESYYARGEGMEALAKRIQFAPRKKKQALLDAVDLYNQSLALGYAPAGQRVDEVKAQLK